MGSQLQLSKSSRFLSTLKSMAILTKYLDQRKDVESKGTMGL